MLSTNDDQTPECPLCLEKLEIDDLNFFPCTCGYQICRFCWHRIRTDENGLCPACRKQYPEDPADFKPLTAEEMQQIKNEKRQKDLQRKQKLSENRKHLANVRVVQKNLVFVVGLPARLADAEALKKHDYFGKFGKILKVIVNHSTSYAGSQGPSASAYVTYQKAEDALRAIQAVNNSKVDGRTLKASLGTTKYCSHFLKKQPCPKQDCMYLHELGDDAASFTKEEMSVGKHQEYEQKLYEQMLQSSSLSNRKQLSPAEHIDSSQFSQKERWPSPQKEDNRQNGLPENVSSQLSQNNAKSDSFTAFKTKRSSDGQVGPSKEQLSDREQQQQQQHLLSQFRRMNITREGYTNSEAEYSDATCLHAEPNNARVDSSFSCSNSGCKNVNFVSSQSVNKAQPLENYDAFEKPDLIKQKSQQSISSGSELRKGSALPQQCGPNSPVSHTASLPNGMLLSNQFSLKNAHMPQEWVSAHPREYFKHRLPEMPSTGTSHLAPYSVNSQEGNCGTSSLNPERNNSACGLRYQCPRFTSVHEPSTHSYHVTGTLSDHCVNNSDSTGESSHEAQDDELGFDPWHESSKGLADLMIKEAGEKARANYSLPNFNSLNSLRRPVIPVEPVALQNRCIDNSHYAQRQVVPPPGFHVNNFGANSSIPRPFATADAFSGKMLPVMNTYNHSPTSAPLNQYQQQQLLHSQIGIRNNMLHLPESGIRPHPREWQENITNLPQNTVDHSFGSLLPQHIPLNMGRTSHPTWNNSVPTDVQWLSQEQAALNQGFIESKLIHNLTLSQLK